MKAKKIAKNEAGLLLTDVTGENREVLAMRVQAMVKLKAAEASVAAAHADLASINAKLFAAGILSDDVVAGW